MIQEIMGLPGVGKTTYCCKINMCVPVFITPRKRFFYAMKFLLQHPVVFSYFFYKTIKVPQQRRSLRNKVFFLLFTSFAKEAGATGNKILDEGLYQYILSLYEINVSRSDVSRDLRMLYALKRKVIHLVAEEDVRHARLQKRGRHFALNLTERERESFTKTMRETENIIRDLKDGDKYYLVLENNA